MYNIEGATVGRWIIIVCVYNWSVLLLLMMLLHYAAGDGVEEQNRKVHSRYSK